MCIKRRYFLFYSRCCDNMVSMVILIIMHQFVLDEHMIDVIRANGIATACVTTGVVSLGDTVSYVCDTKVVGVIVKMYIPARED